MIGPLEFAIIAVILLVIFGARYLPRLGRSAGKGVRIGSEKGKELAATAQEKAKDIDTKSIARQAGEHVREARELRDVVKGESKPAEPAAAGAAAPATEPGPAAEATPPPAPTPEPEPEPVPEVPEPEAEAESKSEAASEPAPGDDPAARG